MRLVSDSDAHDLQGVRDHHKHIGVDTPNQLLRLALLQIDSYLVSLFSKVAADLKTQFSGQFHHLTVPG